MSTIISRARLTHADLGDGGGPTLHAAQALLYTNLGDYLDSRFFTKDALADSSSEDFYHNFKSALSELYVFLFIRDTGTGELTRVTSTSSPSLDDFTIAATPAFTTTKLRVTNNSGGPRDIAVVIRQGIQKLGTLYDVDLVSDPPLNGEALVYNSALDEWAPGSSGDSSFQIESIAANVATIKRGSIFLSDGRELHLDDDTALDLMADVGSNNGAVTSPAISSTYYLYLDLQNITFSETNLGMDVAVSLTSFVIFSSRPRLMDLKRYIPLALLSTDGSGDYTDFRNLPTRRHEQIELAPFMLKRIGGSTAILQGGFLLLDNNIEIGTYDGAGSSITDFGKEIQVNLDTVLGSTPANDTAYYLYLDISTFGAASTLTESGRKVIPITEANFALSITTPDSMSNAQYIPIASIKSHTSGNTWPSTTNNYSNLDRNLHSTGSALVLSPSAYNKYVGTSLTYTTLAAAIAAASPGDSILVTTNTTEIAGDVSLNVADVRIQCMPGAKVQMSGAMTNGLRLTAARVQLVDFNLSLAPSGAQARGISIEAADCRIAGRMDYTTAQTLTDGLHITAGGTRSCVLLGVNRTAGTITNLETDLDGASFTQVWGG